MNGKIEQRRIDKSTLRRTPERKIMRTDSQRDASRANGAKSHGPKTEEGKARSRLNSLKHGQAAKSLVLTIEDVDNFCHLVDAYYDDFIPRNQAECNIVDDMIISRWRLQRDWTIEVATYEVEMDNQTEKLNKEYKDLGHAYRFGLAFKALADTSKALQMNSRYETSHRRAYYKAYNTLMQQRAAEQRMPNPPSNAPQPAPEPTSPPAADPDPAPEAKNFRTNPSHTQLSPAQQRRQTLLALANKAAARCKPAITTIQANIPATNPLWTPNTTAWMQPAA